MMESTTQQLCVLGFAAICDGITGIVGYGEGLMISNSHLGGLYSLGPRDRGDCSIGG
jgi:hypothetical protein